MAKKRANGEGSIRKRKDGRWEGRYTAGHDPNTGKTIYKNVLGKTQGEVKEKLKKAIADSQQLDVTRATTYTVRTWIKLWYEVYAEPRLREKTKDYYLNYQLLHLLPNWREVIFISDELSGISLSDNSSGSCGVTSDQLGPKWYVEIQIGKQWKVVPLSDF